VKFESRSSNPAEEACGFLGLGGVRVPFGPLGTFSKTLHWNIPGMNGFRLTMRRVAMATQIVMDFNGDTIITVAFSGGF
jgi:hypothetical protein